MSRESSRVEGFTFLDHGGVGVFFGSTKAVLLA